MKMVFINFPVVDVQRSAEFYSKLGFIHNKEMSNERASSMVWADNIWFMLLSRDFYREFIAAKTIADTKTTSAALISLSMPSTEAVKSFGRIARENGGDYYAIDVGMPEEEMFGLEVQDPDGNMLEAIWMKDPM